MEHAVLVTIPLKDGEFGSEQERQELYGLESQLTAAIAEKGAGEFDGNDFGGGQVTFYMYGPDADALYDAIAPVFEKHGITGVQVTKRYGEPDDPDAAQSRFSI